MKTLDPRGRTPHFLTFPNFVHLCALKTHDLYTSAKSLKSWHVFENLTWTRSQEFPTQRLHNAGKCEASDESSMFSFIVAVTVGRNLFCLDQCDTLSSSHWRRRSQELDKEWNIWTNVCLASSCSVWTVVTSLVWIVTQDYEPCTNNVNSTVEEEEGGSLHLCIIRKKKRSVSCLKTDI